MKHFLFSVTWIVAIIVTAADAGDLWQPPRFDDSRLTDANGFGSAVVAEIRAEAALLRGGDIEERRSAALRLFARRNPRLLEELFHDNGFVQDMIQLMMPMDRREIRWTLPCILRAMEAWGPAENEVYFVDGDKRTILPSSCINCVRRSITQPGFQVRRFTVASQTSIESISQHGQRKQSRWRLRQMQTICR